MDLSENLLRQAEVTSGAGVGRGCSCLVGRKGSEQNQGLEEWEDSGKMAFLRR
jgi:hypothetical protein